MLGLMEVGALFIYVIISLVVVTVAVKWVYKNKSGQIYLNKSRRKHNAKAGKTIIE